MAESNTLEKNGGSLPLTAAAAPAAVPAATAPYPLPRVTIRFCTQCKWMLRAAYVGSSPIYSCAGLPSTCLCLFLPVCLSIYDA